MNMLLSSGEEYAIKFVFPERETFFTDVSETEHASGVTEINQHMVL